LDFDFGFYTSGDFVFTVLVFGLEVPSFGLKVVCETPMSVLMVFEQ